MMIEAPLAQKKKGYIDSTTLVLLALASGFFPRILMLVKFPSLVNFLHFAIVPLAFGVAILNSKSRDRQQIAVCKKILFALMLLLTVSFASAWWNDAGIINVVLHFLLFNEPAMLLLAIVCISMSEETLARFRKYVLGFGFFNLFLALLQRFVLRWDIRGRSPCPNLDGVDTITGVFICQGAGVIVSASVTLALATYFLVAAKNQPLWIRALVMLACFLQIIEADAKQVLIVGAVAFALLSLANMKDIRKALLSVIGVVLGFQAFWWAMFQFPFLGAFRGWIRPEIYGPEGEATRFKLFGIQAILDHMDSPINWLLGLGPGHTLDRLGMVMLREYSSLLNPFGATRMDEISLQVWQDMADSWLANGSTMFSPFFSWAGLWGDLGIIGLVAYFYLYSLLWRYVCKDDLSRFQLLCVFVVGWIQAGMQEPGFMLFLACLLGLRWQELRLKSQKDVWNQGVESVMLLPHNAQ
ncbi:hypothetical protein [Leptolyngbya sp. 7M]|uniref:hypothetical protein n=1 Tax=Leptolyngbya sp. 7M TaxID=2812896 RepID=UPI001B8B3FC0|nr:hypothetical protein [Leptolyngbya sp. 7M]QYO67397.1 hypothetical protein JVX88_11720 [Leptolyngbya sp. 7M]